MQNRTDYAGLSFWDRLRQTAGQYRRVGEMAAAAVGGVVFSSAQILGGITPFGVALAAAVPEELFLPALFGALFGYLWFPAPGSTMEYAAAILLLGGVRWTLSTGSLWRRIPQAPAVLAGGCMLAVSYTHLDVYKRQRFDREQVEDYIRRIQASRLKKSSEEVSQMSPDKLDDYIKKIAENKRG